MRNKVEVTVRVRKHDQNPRHKRWVWGVYIGEKVVVSGHDSSEERAAVLANRALVDVLEGAWEKARKHCPQATWA